MSQITWSTSIQCPNGNLKFMSSKNDLSYSLKPTLMGRNIAKQTTRSFSFDLHKGIETKVDCWIAIKFCTTNRSNTFERIAFYECCNNNFQTDNYFPGSAHVATGCESLNVVITKSIFLTCDPYLIIVALIFANKKNKWERPVDKWRLN